MSIVRSCFLIAVVCVPSSAPVFAGKLEKAFAALNEKNYFLARELLQKQAEKHPAAAWYGLSVITGRADNPFYQLDSSFLFIQRAGLAFSASNDKERETIKIMGVDNDAIVAQQEHVYGIAWAQAQAVNTITSYDTFIRTYPHSEQIAQATLLRDHLAFEEARATNTTAAYKAFIDRYPDARDIYEARSRMQGSIFREAAPDGTMEEYEQFIAEHPESPYVRNAEDSLFHLSAPHGTSEEIHRFILKYPHCTIVAEAWRAIHAWYTKDLSANSITNFLKDYPDYPFMSELVDEYKTASLVLYPFRQNGKWGYIDDAGVERIKAVYDFAEPFIGGQAQVGRDSLVGTINKSGKEVIAIKYDDVLDPGEGFATVERGDRAGVMDHSGKLVVEMIYSEVGEFAEGRAYAEKDGKYGYIDATGRTVIPFQYDAANTFHSGAAVVKQQGQSGVIDNKGDVVVRFQYEWIEGFGDPVSRVRKGGRTGLISTFGDVLLTVEHDHVGAFNDGLALVIDKDKCGYVDMKGAWAIAQQFEVNEATRTIGDFHNGVARVMSGGKLGLINTHGERLFPAQYAEIGLMESGVVPVKKKNKWGYAARSFTTVAEAKYDGAWEMHGGYARVRSGDLFGLIDSTGKETIAPKYAKLSDVRDRLTIATENGKSGVIDVSGKVIVQIVFDTVEIISREAVKVTRGERIAYVRIANGQFIWKEDGFDAAPSPK